jgi:hypothetical protein
MAFEAHLENLTRRDVARNKISVRRIFFFEEVPAFRFGISRGLRTSPSAFGTQTRPPSPRADSDISLQFVFAGIDVG